ncbi:uncharacterized protein LOC122392661 [Amphibalanus amphitrite]|uniref:uncharacterized protein LOC122392661 n=1 Tax=Amphibalanus amphitrite TaxID=1232801 RepID=UPI001C91434B|nr:uncharacterized protein LOC122392661 [Amphibalanus amphitrite]
MWVSLPLSGVLAVLSVGAGALPALQAEHRLPPDLVLPDTASIPGQMLADWGVDKFFSLWYIFALSDNVEVSKDVYTVLAPSNAAFERVKLTPGFSDRSHIVTVLRNHILLGEVVTEERLKQLPDGGTFSVPTLLGTHAVFANRNGTLYVNNTEIIGDILEITNASIVRTDDYIPLPDTYQPADEPQFAETIIEGSGSEAGDLTASEAADLAGSETAVLPLLNEVGDLGEPEFGPPIESDPIQNEFTAGSQRVKIPPAGKDSFLEAVEDALSLLKAGVGEFQGFFYESNITGLFEKDEEYTLFLPVNEAFQRFYPIDWGFNPFLVTSFTRETILNHFVKGKLTSKDITNGMKVSTMGGKELVFKVGPESTSVNGKPLFLGDTPISHGNILFLDELLFVDYDIIAELRLSHRDKETAPVLAGMAGEAMFLAHLISKLTHRDNSSTSTYSKFVEYIYSSFDDIAMNVSNDYKYTFLALDDAAVSRALGGPGQPDPLLTDGALRDRTLLSHLIRQRLYLHDLKDGFTATTLGGQTIEVAVTDEGTFINGVRLLPRHEHVYNLGNVLFIESFPFITPGELQQRGADAALEPEGSGSELNSELDPKLGLGRYEAGLGLGLEGVESFAGEAGLPEGMMRADGVLEVSSSPVGMDVVMDGP